jgi:toxin ParE1/3/4
MAEAFRSTDANLDVLEIWLRIARHNLPAAEKLVDEIEAKCRQLAQMPELGRRRDELQAGLRSFPVRSYVVIYRPVTDGIFVHRVLHGSRDLSQLF